MGWLVAITKVQSGIEGCVILRLVLGRLRLEELRTCHVGGSRQFLAL